MENESNVVNGGISSKYCDIEYRPSEDNSNRELNKRCSLLLVDLDDIDSELNNNRLNNKRILKTIRSFFDAIAECESPEEYKNLRKFFDMIANVGDTGKKFVNNFKNYLNPNAKMDVLTWILKDEIQRLENEEEKYQESKKESISKKFDNFIKKYSSFCDELDNYQRKGHYNDYEIESFLAMFIRLRNELKQYEKEISSNTYTKYRNEISNIIDNLKCILDSLNNIRNMQL